MKKFNAVIAILVMFLSVPLMGNDLVSKSPEGAKVYFINLENGQTVKGSFKVQFGLEGMGIAPAGVNIENTGHHHLLINMDTKTINFTKPLPASGKIKHFGKGQTETILKLLKGQHTLQLLLGNYLHIPHDKPVISPKITINVK